MRASAFTPSELTVVKGAIVSFTNDDGIDHNVIFDPPLSPGVADIPTHSTGTNTRTFGTSGTFPYHCSIHGGVGVGMNGKIIVP
jgi:plastocyanin